MAPTWISRASSSSTASRARITPKGARPSWKSASRPSRENRLRILIASLVIAASSSFAAWPEKPIKVYIGYAAGGSTDVVARLLQPKLGEKLGQPIIIENKPGGAGDLAAEMMLQTPADGYTLM